MTLRNLIICISTWVVTSVAFAHGDVHERIEELTRKYAAHPTDEVLIRRARLYLEEGHADAARDDLNKALKIAPDRYESFYYLAQAHLMLEQHPQALRAVERFIAKTDNGAARARGMTLQGDILMSAGKPLEAADLYLAALDHLSEPNPEDYLKAADAFHAAGRAESLAVLDRGITKLGPLATLQERAIAIEMETGRYEAALQRVELMLAEKQRVPFLLYRKGLILAALGRAEQSRQTFQQALVEFDALPDGRRSTRAAQELQTAIRQELDRR